MTVYYPTFRPAVQPLTMVTRVRELPYAGEVLVRVGNRVEPDEVVARTLLPARGRRYPVARILGIAEKDLPKAVLLEDGAEVEAGDILVRVGRLRPRIFRSPLSGTLSTAEAARGYLVITPPAQTFELRAALKGFVLAVEPYRSVTIQTPAAVVQGIFGLGEERHGVLRVAVTSAGDELLPEMVDERSALSILLGGGPVGAAALERAISYRVRGLVVGSIPVEELQAFVGYRGDADWEGDGWAFPPGSAGRDFPLTLVVTEGFGRRPMSTPAFELLASYDGQEALIEGRTCLHGAEMYRPQVVIPLPRANPADIPPEEDAERLGVGREVRLLSEDLLGQTGTVVGLPRGLRTMAGGIRCRVAEVRLETGSVVAVPLENLEVLGSVRRTVAR